MTQNILVLPTGEKRFIPIAPSVKLAILLPTARWTAIAQSVIGSLIGVANEEVAVLIADNSENQEKHIFLQKICDINPHILTVIHEKNIGATSNILYLFDWCKDIPFCAMMADDDWMSPTYHTDALRLLRNNPNATYAEAGHTVLDKDSNGVFVNITQAPIQGKTPIERIQQWNATIARITTYNVSERSSLENAVHFYRTTPLNGITLLEDLLDLSRLGTGEFISERASGFFVHHPKHASDNGNPGERFYHLLHKDAGLEFPFIYFSSLSTASQCAIFLMGTLSPIDDLNQKKLCAQHVFRHIFLASFLPTFANEESRQIVANMFADHPKVLAGFLKFCLPPFATNPVFDYEIIDWLIEIIKVFENKSPANTLLLSERFSLFVNSQLNQVSLV